MSCIINFKISRVYADNDIAINAASIACNAPSWLSPHQD